MENGTTPKVSVIAPVYGVENFIGRCVESLMNQTLDSIEYIFVDDATPDKSVDILKSIVDKYPTRKDFVKIIKHPENKGLPAARNTGLNEAKGEYIYHCDSDDFLEPLMLELLYDKAKAGGCDYVWSNWFLTFESNSRHMHQPSATSPRNALEIALAGGMKYNVWNKLVKHSLYEESGILFPEGRSMGEDMTMIRLLAKARKTANVEKPLYHYIRTNSGAMTQIYSDNHLAQLKLNTDETIDYIRCNVSDDNIEREIDWFKLNTKLPFLFTGRSQDFRRWKEWYPEANRNIMSNSLQSIRTRLLQMSALYGMTFINKLYNSIVFNVVYGKIYK